MAVKVMVAPAIASGAIGRRSAPAERRERSAPAKPKRRRSSVYDADGNEVFITLMCLKCQKMRPLSLFGLRRMADGAIRNQPWCRSCRSAAGAEKPRRGRVAQEPAAAVDVVPAGAAAAEPAAPATRPANVAAEVAAALAAGMRR